LTLQGIFRLSVLFLLTFVASVFLNQSRRPQAISPAPTTAASSSHRDLELANVDKIVIWQAPPPAHISPLHAVEPPALYDPAMFGTRKTGISNTRFINAHDALPTTPAGDSTGPHRLTSQDASQYHFRFDS
jgi:hypothetical protein